MHSDPYFKQFFVSQLRTYAETVSHSVKVGELPLEIDLVFVQTNSPADLSPLLGDLAEYVKNFNIWEFKGSADRFSHGVLHKVWGYMGFYWETEKLPLTAPLQTIGWVISSTKPHWLNHEPSIRSLQDVVPGLYQYWFFDHPTTKGVLSFFIIQLWTKT